MTRSLILLPVFALTLSSVATAHELDGSISVNIFGLTYTECVREASKKQKQDFAARWCFCALEQMGLHDQEDRPDQNIFFPFSKHFMHAAEVCNARHSRGKL